MASSTRAAGMQLLIHPTHGLYRRLRYRLILSVEVLNNSAAIFGINKAFNSRRVQRRYEQRCFQRQRRSRRPNSDWSLARHRRRGAGFQGNPICGPADRPIALASAPASAVLARRARCYFVRRYLPTGRCLRLRCNERGLSYAQCLDAHGRRSPFRDDMVAWRRLDKRRELEPVSS